MKTIELPGGPHAVLALHGLLGNPLEMQFVGKKLQKAGYSVVIPLIPGYGYSSGQGQSYRTTRSELWYEEVLRHFDALKKTHETVSVVGVCIGNELELRLATTLAYDGWSIPKYSFLLPLAYYTPLRWMYSYRERYPYGLKNENLRAWIAREMTVSDSSAAGASRLSAEGIFQAHRLIKQVRRQLGKVSTPALIVHAEEDDVASTKSADLVESAIASPIKRKVILHNSYHIITLDNEKEVVAAEAVGFFDQHTQSAVADLELKTA